MRPVGYQPSELTEERKDAFRGPTRSKIVKVAGVTCLVICVVAGVAWIKSKNAET